MAEIRRIPFLRHLRAEASSHVLHYRKGQLVRSGRGLSFWFRHLSASIAELPIDDREIPFLFHGRSADFQDVTTQGIVTYRVVSPERLAERVDFSISFDHGGYRKQPLDQLAQLVTQLAQQLALTYIAEQPLRTILTEGIAVLRKRITAGLSGEGGVDDTGIEIASVRIAAIQPTSELERALQTPTLEAIHKEADEATFERRAQAVMKERAIQENELQNQIELARREEQLIEQQGQNQRCAAIEQGEAVRIEAEGDAVRTRLQAGARGESIRLVEGARVEAEKERVGLYRDLPNGVLIGLAAQELAAKLKRIDHVHIGPEMLGPMLADLVGTTTERLKKA